MKTCAKILLIVLSCSLCFAGDLQPSASPGPTMKTLDQVEPRIPIPGGSGMAVCTINTPGSYYLEGNRSAAGVGIAIYKANVTIDLMGYTLSGTDSGTSNYGIYIYGTDSNNIEIRNGTIRDFGSHGIYSNNYRSFGTRLINVRSISNNNKGAYLPGSVVTIQNCTFAQNNSYGLDVSYSGNISNCLIFDNEDYGINTGDGSILKDCTAYGNNGYGIFVGCNSSVSNCTAHDNVDRGFGSAEACNISDCTAYNNGGTGFNIGSGSTIKNCSSYINGGSGFWTGETVTVTNCTGYNNDGHGIFTNSHNVISKCSFYSNQNSEISASYRCKILDCTVAADTNDGIYVYSQCTVVGNTCNVNGSGGTTGAGIRAVSTGNRIESNTVCGNDYGIRVVGTNNMIIKNSASGNTTNYSIVTGNSYGPIVDVTGDGDISGTAGANHPWANFTH